MQSPVRYKQRRVHVHGEMTIYTCGELKSQLLEQLQAHPKTAELDLSHVTEIDTAGLQLVLMVRRHVSDAGLALRVVNPSRAVAEVLELCRLDVAASAATTADAQ